MKEYLKNFKENKKAYTLSLLSIIAITLFLCGATYAYFKAQYGSNADANVDVATKTVDQLSFRMFNAIESETPGISITATQDNFNQTDRQNATGTTYGTATFTANNATADKASPDEITAKYNMYVDISANNFEYTTEGENPPAELILTVKVSETGNDADMREITAIEGLTPVTIEGVTGFDVTTVKGLIKIAEDYEIKALSGATTTHKWAVTLTFVNLNSNQNDNTNKTFSAKLLMQKEKINLIADVCTNGDNLANCMTNMSLGDKTGLYHHNGTITTKSLGIDENDTVLDANDSSYRYAGANPSNYVCFGYDDPAKAYAENWCPDDNLYRIIGVFNDDVVGSDGNLTGAKEERVKLIKAKKYGSYYWSGSSSNKSNVWANSTLNTEILNGETWNSYLPNLGDYANKIATTRWQVGGAAYTQLATVTAKVAYQNEIGSPVNNDIQDSKIGLMYVSEYMYAADPTQKKAWSELAGISLDTTKGYNVVKDFNWLYLGINEWTISRISDFLDYAFLVYYYGLVDLYGVNGSAVVRPSFSLLNSVTYAGGSGTQADPIRIN